MSLIRYFSFVMIVLLVQKTSLAEHSDFDADL